MKLSSKIVFSCITTIAIVFSLGSTIMLYQNHRHLLDETLKQKLSAHEIEVNALESKLVQDSLDHLTDKGNDSDKMNERFKYYLQQNNSRKNRQNEGYVLYDEHGDVIYSDISAVLYKKLKKDAFDTYYILDTHTATYSIFTSKLTAGNLHWYISAAYNIEDVYQERTRQFQSFLIIDACILLFSYLLLQYISHYLIKPIQKLNETSQHIALGNYKERTNIQSDDEVGELSKSFDHMADAIEANMTQLKQQAEAKEAFMGSFSHEIKTPMTAILGFADMLRTYDCDVETRRKAADYIYTEGKRLNSLSHTMMDLLSLNENTPALCNVCVDDIITALKKYYQGTDCSCRLEFICASAVVLSNQELLFTMLRNLIDNAIKASSDKQLVLIKGVVYERMYQFSIIDEGIGMNEKDVEMALEPFYMADKSRTRKQGGAGLGLSIVKRILDIHHSHLDIKSIPDKGTTLSFMLEVIPHEN